MSDQVVLSIVAGIVTTLGAVITGVVTVLVVKIRNDVKATRKIVTQLPVLVTEEATTTRAAVEKHAVSSQRLQRDGSPDDMSAGAVHTHQRIAQADEQ